MSSGKEYFGEKEYFDQEVPALFPADTQNTKKDRITRSVQRVEKVDSTF